MAAIEQIIELYSKLAEEPEQDFGWAKGIENAKAHGYDEAWFEQLPSQIWPYCAAVGNPFKEATIHKGDTVVDLGCGAGVDLLIAALLTGDRGKVIGVDITPKMVEKATLHAKLAGFDHVEVMESGFENLAIDDATVDVVISNGAINLSSCKEKVFSEIFRILKPEGRLYFADMIDTAVQSSCCGTQEQSCNKEPQEEDWANCVAGTLSQEKLIGLMTQAGFGDVFCSGLTDYKTSDTTYGATFKAQKILRKAHWEKLFQTADYSQVLWHQRSPSFSLEMIETYTHSKEDAIIDAGCGASYLADHLIQKGYTNLTLLDLSQTSLDIVKQRLGAKGDIPRYICHDVTRLVSRQRFDLWHDRAVFHFLTQEEDRTAYFQTLHQLLKQGGIAVISTFALDGPNQCAGLDTVQYDASKMQEILPHSLQLIDNGAYVHSTPKDTKQAYHYFIIQRL